MTKTRKAPTCQRCKSAEAEWAMQYVASDTPSFTILGNHYRGFPVTKLCNACKTAQRLADQDAGFALAATQNSKATRAAIAYADEEAERAYAEAYAERYSEW